MGSSEARQGVPDPLLARFRRGCVIPAMPLALDAERRIDLRRQTALIRYYIDAGAGGLAVGVHTTQFAIRRPGVDLFEPVLRLASQAIDEWCACTDGTILKIAGICGRTPQAVREASLARDAGYHAGLVSLAAFDADDDIDALVAHCATLAELLPIIGFYLQPAVGGRVLPYRFWRGCAEIDGLIGIKIAPFNRYHTLDVVRAVCDAGREGEVALYTGNDDHIIGDLLTIHQVETPSGRRAVRIVGGLLGQWAVWTHKAVELLNEIHTLIEGGADIPTSMLTRGARLTDANGAIFDAAHGFAGCLPGIHEVLYRQGLLAGTWCLDPAEVLSPGQAEAITRVSVAYPELSDDDFVCRNLDRWLAC